MVKARAKFVYKSEGNATSLELNQHVDGRTTDLIFRKEPTGRLLGQYPITHPEDVVINTTNWIEYLRAGLQFISIHSPSFSDISKIRYVSVRSEYLFLMFKDLPDSVEISFRNYGGEEVIPLHVLTIAKKNPDPMDHLVSVAHRVNEKLGDIICDPNVGNYLTRDIYDLREELTLALSRFKP